MLRQKVIPRSISINGYSCKVWYPGQPLTCDVCRKEGHIAWNCPIRDRCRNCLQPGHVYRNCSNPPRAWDVPDVDPGTGASVDPTPAEAAMLASSVPVSPPSPPAFDHIQMLICA